MSRFFIYAVIVVLVTSGSSWVRGFGGSGQNTGQAYRGSVWSPNTGGGGFGGGSGGGGHK